MAVPVKVEPYTPTDWQLEDLTHLAERMWSANWSEMGCYKTTTGLWLAAEKVKQFEDTNIIPTVLIVTTRSGKGTYFDAVPKSLEGWRIYNVDSNKASEVILGWFREKVDPVELIEKIANGGMDAPHIILAHYNCFSNKSKMNELLRKLTYTMIIVDEAHRIKNRNAQWTRNIKMLKTLGGHKHAMTGTGFINRPDEMWSILNFLSSKTFGSYWAFRRYFCDEINIGGFTKIIGVKSDKLEEFRDLRKRVGVRRVMAEVHSGINEPIFTPKEVDLNPTQRKMYNEIKGNLRTMDRNGNGILTPNVLSQLSRLRQICVATPELTEDYYDEKLERRVQKIKLREPSSKLDAVMDILEELEWDDENKQQVVIFSNFKDPLELLKARLDKEQITYLHMQQKHNDEQRYNMWHNIWPSKEHRVFMATLQLGSESINLSSAQHCIFLDRSWSPKDNNQGVSRVFRPGQTGTANIIHINALSTTDQRIERANLVKMGWFNAIFGDDKDGTN